MAAPLSLKKQTVLYIVCNLEHFKCESLKALPEDLRSQVVVNLPPIDICRLEAEGLEWGKEPYNEWDEVATRKMNRISNYEVERGIMYQGYYEDWRAYYFVVVFHALLNRIKPSRYRNHYEFVLHLLLGVSDCVGVKDWSKYRFTHFAPIVNDRPLIPNRHLRFLVTKRSESSFIKFFLEECPYRPRFLWVVCDLFSESEVYKKHSSELLSKLFSKVERVVFTFDYDSKLDTFRSQRDGRQKSMPYDVPSLVLKMILADESPVLSGLEFRDISHEMVEESIKIAGPLFYVPLGSISNKNIPYRGLKEIYIQIAGPKGCPGNELLQKLSSVVKNQKELEKLTLVKFIVDRAHLNEKTTKFFLTVASSLVHKASFKNVSLKQMYIPMESVQELIDAYLASPALHRQTFHLESITIVGQPPKDKLVPRSIVQHADSCQYKVIEFYHTDVPFNYFKWFFGHEMVALRRLELCNCKLLEAVRERYEEPEGPENILHLMATSQDVQVEQIDISNLNFLHQRTTASDIEKIVSEPHLRSLSFRSCNIGHHGVLPDITKALRPQIELGTLRGLSLVSNHLGDIPYEEMQDFLDVFFSMPNIEEMDLSISHNDFNSTHFHMLYDTWKLKAGGKRLKLLTCIGGEYPRYNREIGKKLDEIAVRCYHM